MSKHPKQPNPWLLATRPKTLPAAAAPVLVGIALAFHDGMIRPFTAVLTLLAALLIQIGTNYANDLFDYLKGTDTEERIGPLRVTQAGLLTPKQMQWGMIAVFAMSVLIGFYLAWVGGWSIVFIGTSAIICGILYTGGPYPLGYHGWGELFVFIFFGLVAVSGTYYLQTGEVSTDALLIGCGQGALATAILIVNNLRDTKTDALTGKRTLAVRLGPAFTRIEYTTLVGLAMFIPLLLVWLHPGDIAPLLTLFTLPLAFRHSITIWLAKPENLNPMLGATAHMQMMYSLLLALGLIV